MDSSPNFKSFIRAIGGQWGSLVSGAFSIPFTIAGLVFEGWPRAIFLVLAACALIAASYRIWAHERRAAMKLKEALSPKLNVVYDENLEGCIRNNVNFDGGRNRLFRVRVSAISQVVAEKCHCDIISINGPGGIVYNADTLRLTFAPAEDFNPSGLDIRPGTPAFADIVWITGGDTSPGTIHPSTFRYKYPNSFVPGNVFRLSGKYTLKINISSLTAPPVAVTLELDWTGRWSTTTLRQIP